MALKCNNCGFVKITTRVRTTTQQMYCNECWEQMSRASRKLLLEGNFLEKSASTDSLPPLSSKRHSIFEGGTLRTGELPPLPLVPQRIVEKKIVLTRAGFSINWENIDILPLHLPPGITSFTVGDLHGNTLTLIIIFIKFGALEIEQVYFDELKYIILSISSNTEILNWEIYQRFSYILEQHCKFKATNATIRLLGDVLADRMSHDALTLRLLSIAIYNKIQIEIIFSNHDSMFIKSLYQPDAQMIDYANEPFTSTYISNLKLIQFIKTYLLTDLEKKFLVYDIKVYLKCLKIFSYVEAYSSEFSPNQKIPKFFVFSHAAIEPLSTISILETFAHPPESIVFQNLTKNDCKELIDKANSDFSNFMRTIYNDSMMNNLTSPTIQYYHTWISDHSSPLSRVIWHRLRSEPVFHQSIPLLKDGAQIYNIHGHDQNSREDTSMSLDNYVGKTYSIIESKIRQDLFFYYTKIT